MLLWTMGKNRLLLYALLGIMAFGLFPKLEAQDASGSADLILLIDGSESVGAANFLLVSELAVQVIEGLAVGRDAIRVALVLYGADPEIQFYLNSYDNKESILSAIRGLKYPGGIESNLGAALEEVVDSLLGQDAGGRSAEGVPQALVVISAGESTDDVSQGERALKQASVYTFGIAAGDSAIAQLEAIATDKSFVLSAPDVRTVASMGDQILPYINGVAERSIVIQTDFTEALAVGKRDIIFLIDSSMGATFINAVREFIKRFIDTMPIGPDQVQVGVAMFSTTPRSEINLNSYSSKESLSSALARIKPKPSVEVNIGAALDFVRTSMLRPESGSRIEDQVTQLVLLLTSKKSKDSVQQPAEALRQMGVLTLAAGSKAADQAELRQIAFDETVVFIMKDFRMLLRNPREIISPLSTLTGVVVTDGPTETGPVVDVTTVHTQKVVRDIVFLVDGSTYSGYYLQPVLDFITGVVNRLDVRPERVRIGLMQFAEEQKTEFHLNTHNTKQDVLSAIAQLSLMGGRALKTGAALEYALTNHFQPSVGSRRRQGIQQVLVLITGGPSQDEVKTIADRVAIEGVLTFAVGVGQVEESFLKTVAFVENLAYYRENYADLSSVVDEIMTPLITVVGETDTAITEIATPGPSGGERDVAFLIDGSDDVRGDFPYIRDFISKVIEPLDIGFNKVRVSVVQHSERPSPSFYLNTYQTKDEVLRAVNGLTLTGGRSLNTGAALTFMKNTILSPSYGSRSGENVPQFLIVLTGGRSRDSVKEPAVALKTDGVVPFGVGVKNADPKQIEAISHNPSFAFNVKEFSQLNTVQEKLRNYVNLPDQGLKVFLEKVELDAAQRDIVFILDGSDDTRDAFKQMCHFVQRVVDKLNIGLSGDRVSLVQYSREPSVHFYLNTHATKQEVLNSIETLQHQGGNPLNTGRALDYAKKNMFIASSGSRLLDGVPQILVLVTGGRSHDDVRAPAAALKQDQIVPFSVGNQNADVIQLQAISYTPGHTLTVPQFDDLQTIEQKLLSYVKIVPRQPRRIPPTATDAGKADVVFLIDASDGTKESFLGMQNFVQTLVQKLNVAPNNDRVSVAQYSDDAAFDFLLNTHSSSDDVINHVKRLIHKGGRLRLTGAALQYVKDNIFTAAAGSRYLEGVTQFLILLSSGRSNDDIRGPVKALKDIGVISLSIGTTNADTLELQTISHQPNYFFISEFENILDVQDNIFALIKGVSYQRLPTMTSQVSESAKRDVAFLIDGSDDSKIGFEAIRNFIQRVVESLNVEEDLDRVAVVQYSRDPTANFYLSSYSTKKEVLNSIRSMRHKSGRPQNTGAALLFIKENIFTQSSGSRRHEDVPQILYLFSGGRSGDDVRIISQNLRENSIKVFTIGTRNADTLELQTMSSTPAYAFSVPDFTSINSIVQRVASVLTSGDEIPEQLPTPEGKALGAGRNIVFLIDGSDNASDRFTSIREFVANLAETFDVGQEKDRIAVVQFSNTAATSFNLSKYSSSSEVTDAVRNLKPIGGRPQYIGQALQFVRDNIFTPRVGSQQIDSVSQNLVLVAGGRSRDSPRGPANALKSMGVAMFAIGSRLTDPIEMEAISSRTDYAMAVYDFHELKNVRQNLLTKLMGERQKGDTEVDGTGFKRDIAFLVDGSDSTRRGFPEIRDFLYNIITNVNVGIDNDRISIIQYSNVAVANFYLNSFLRKEDVLNAVKVLSHKGGRPLNTGFALRYVKENIFISASGSRHKEGTPQILILLTSGKSRDSISEAAFALKKNGVIIYGIGGKYSDSDELQTISSENNVLSLADFSELSKIQVQLLEAMKSNPSYNKKELIAEVDRKRRDVVFLLDGSDGTRNGFPAMKEFVQRMVEKLEVAENRDHISVVQYSRDPEAHFYLNSYTTKVEVLDRVRGLRHKGGRPLNTGAALQYVIDNIFAASSGSRRLEGVPQILILLSEGRSFDSVDAAASSLKELGVLTFGIGTRGSDSRELQRISYEPNYALSVSDFSELPNVQEQLLASVKAVSIPITPTSQTVTADYVTPRKDIVFLLDGSDGTRNSFPAMRDFLQRVVEQNTIEANRDRVSVVQYSREAEVHFYLNSYTTKEEVLDRVRGLRHKGGRPLNTGAALQYARDNVFTASSGSRRLEGVPQILILLSGGRSFDSVDAAASSLKELGILTFGIGSRGSDSRELQRISYDPNYALSVSDFSELPNVQEQLLASVQAVAMPITPTSPTLTADDAIPRKDVVFMLDGSDGTRNTFPAMRDFVQRVVEQFDIEANRDRVSVVQYSRDAEVNFYLNTYATKVEILNTVRGLRHRGGRPLNTGAALQYVRDSVFTTSAGSRKQEGVPQILILLSGGRSSDNIDTPASALKESGILIFGIGTRNSSREVQRIANDPTYAQPINEFSDLPSVQQQFISSLNNVLVRVKPMTPTAGAERRMARKDVVFLLDGSDGTRSSFPAIRDFVERMVERLNLSEKRDHVSVVQYSRDPEAHFYLNTYSRKEDVLDTLRGLRHKGGRPLNTGAALQYVRDNVFTASSGSRLVEGVPQLLILLSGGKSFDNVDTPASSLKELGVLIFAIGSRSSDSRELQKISNEPSYALSVSDFADLPSVQQQIFTYINTAFVEGTSITTTTIAEGRRQRRDVVFLLDGSDDTRNGFPAMKEFVQRMVEKLEVAENRDHVSVVQYSRDPDAHFYLNTYETKEEILDSVRGLRHKGGRPLHTGAALQYIIDNVFTASSGSRRLEGVPQILILLSGGRSFDSVEAAASSLKELGILTFGIGSRGSDSRELQRISYDPNYALSVSDFSELPNVQEQLLASVKTVSIPITPTSQTVTADYVTPRKDIVFLLDGSDGTRNSFPAMRDFLQRVVEQNTIEANRDRVSVVQYSREAEVHFYLNSYTIKEEVLDRVRGLRHKGGRPLNTGAALQYARDNVFTASSGSRRLEGVPQILILLSGGRSFDSVDAAASSLKELGILTFGIGSRGSDSRELQRISYDPNYALSVSDFSELPNVQEQLLASVQAVAMQITPTSPTLTADDAIPRKDIVFMLDGSDGTRNTFTEMRDFVQRVVEQFDIEANRDRVSVVQYSRDAEVNFYLNTYGTKVEILNTVRGLRHRGGRPLNTGAALQYVRDSVFTTSAGSRKQEGVPQILILLSGGRSSDNIDTPASALKESGILIFGIGTRNSSREVQRIANDPTYAQPINEFSDLPSVQQQFISSLNNVLVRVKPMTPTAGAERRMARKDVVFLLDGSDGTRSSFPAMRDFVGRMVERLNVSEKRDHVSVVQYSRDPEAHFYLNTYSRKEDVLDTLRGLRHKGGRPLNTGAALQYVRDNVFTASSGSRLVEGVPQLLILLSGGKSFDNVDTPASSLKELGVLIFAIGSRSSDSRELQKISNEPSYALSVSDFFDLPSVQQQIFTNINTAFVEGTSITTTTIAEGRRQRRDVVFLLDGSDATRNGFPAMKEFVQRMVEKLEVAENRDHISVVQYSRDPEAHFYLNTYETKEEILDSVRGLRHKGGRPLHTGAALQYVIDNVFTASSGSRRLEGVPQILVLLSGGRSFDSVEAAASSLKELGILTFGIGSRGSDSRELQRISYDPNYALSVSDFSELPNVQEQLLASVKTVSIPITPTSQTVTGTCVAVLCNTLCLVFLRDVPTFF
ncbi:collagen alpha-3(VI) chain-like [Siphateles boraxobius]|uniref:collagen alpha-3(VI) chain-like n=1 Tax=Siphateles boraxobius TaxID=180520 RepID=UPI00406374BF